MKILPAILLCAGVLDCAASTPVSRGDPGYFDAEIKVVAMKYLDDQDGHELFSIQSDGVVIVNGKPIFRVAGTQITTLDGGTVLMNVAPDGTVTGHRAPPEAHFNARGQLVTKHAIVSVVTQQVIGAKVPIDARPTDESNFGEARMMLAWNDGHKIGLRGHYTVFDRRATRLAVLLSTILLMRPGALNQLPGEAAKTP